VRKKMKNWKVTVITKDPDIGDLFVNEGEILEAGPGKALLGFILREQIIEDDITQIFVVTVN